MPANKQAALRYHIINRCLKNKYKRYPSKEDLRQACEDALFNSSGENVSISTIDKDLYAMRYDSSLGYEAPIKFSKEYGGYYYSDPEYSIDNFPLGEEHLEAIRFAAATLEQFKDTSLFEQFQSAIGKISDRVSISPGLTAEDLNDYIQFEWAPKAKGAEFLQTIYQAIRNKQVIEFEYEAFQSGEVKTYILHPYLLKEYRNRWYLIGFSEEKNNFRTFGIDRFLSLHASESKFQRHPDFRSEKFFRHSFGITSAHEAEVRTIQLRFSTPTAYYVKSQIIHPSQRIIEETAEHISIELKLMYSYELEQAILGFGEDIEVLEPLDLKERIVNRLKANLSNYSKSS